MSFEPDIPETPVYKAKPNISKQYSQQSEVEKGKIFDNKESLILAVRLKALSEGFQFLTDRSDPERCYLKCYHFTECDWYLRATLWDNTKKYYITYLNDVHTCSKTQTYPNHQNANKKFIGHLLTPKLQDRSRVLRGKDIQQDILSEYKIHISYQQAMKGKHYGIQQVRGSPYEAFEMLPFYSCAEIEFCIDLSQGASPVVDLHTRFQPHSELLELSKTSLMNLKRRVLFDQVIPIGAPLSLFDQEERERRFDENVRVVSQDRSSFWISTSYEFREEMSIPRPRLELDTGTLSSQSCNLELTKPPANIHGLNDRRLQTY
ncbi:transposase, MuDR, MULE transposase domain protein [Tanacetum coccineum]